MKSIVSFYRGLFAKPYTLLALTLLKFTALLLIAIWLTPPIPCNTYVQGAGCAVRDTTARHLSEIVIAMVFVGFVGVWTVQRYRVCNESPAHKQVALVYACASFGLSLYLVFAITRLVQAG